ncbi:MAG: rod shape-determining protein MreC, partial [Alistipes sp.]|nr:rod shape-determining protein MreC [Candidatus Minthomonas equi]
LSWDGVRPDRVKVYDVPRHTEVAEGDTLISSGYSAMFPYGIPVGTISSISLNDGINYELEISLFENFHSLRYVNVIGFQGQDELAGLMEEM